MLLRPLLAALLLTACGHTASPEALSDAATHDEHATHDAASDAALTPHDAPAVDVAVTTVERARGEALHILREAGRRWVVFASDLDDSASDGAPVLVSYEDGYAVTLRAPKTRAMPTRWREVPRTVWAQVDGRSCALTLDEPAVLSRTLVDYGLGNAWIGLDEDGRRVRPRLSDDDLAREADALSSGGRLLAASIRNDECSGARIATVSPDALVRFTREAPDATLRSRALAAYRASPAWIDAQHQLEEMGGDDERPLRRHQRWDEYRNHTPEVTVWRAPSGRAFVTVAGDVPAPACGLFGGGVWAVYELDGSALTPWGVDASSEFTPLDVVDADGDGLPEFLGEREKRTLAERGWQTTTTLAVPSHVCPC